MAGRLVLVVGLGLDDAHHAPARDEPATEQADRRGDHLPLQERAERAITVRRRGELSCHGGRAIRKARAAG